MLETGAKDDFAKLVEGRVGAAGVSKPVMKKSSSSCPEKMKSLKYVKGIYQEIRNEFIGFSSFSYDLE